MRRTGISISRTRLSGVVREKGLFSSRILMAATVPCSEGHGSREEVARLFQLLRGGLSSKDLPPAILSLPPDETFVRKLSLPVSELRKARIIHDAELDGTLPFDGEAVVSDILPQPSDRPGEYLAFACRQSTVEHHAGRFEEAGFKVERVVPDAVSLLCAAATSLPGFDGSMLSTESDILFLSFSAGALTKTRRFPSASAADPDSLLREWTEFRGEQEAVSLVGFPPPFPESEFRDSRRISFPEPFQDASAIAFGAAAVPACDRQLRGFSLRSPTSSADESHLRERRLRIAAIAVVASLVSLLAALELAAWAATRKVTVVRNQLRSEFTSAAPDVRVVVRETTQIRERIAALDRQRAEVGADLPDPIPLLQALSQSLPEKQSVSVKEVSYDAGRVRLAGEAVNSRIVESYRAALAASLGQAYSVSVQEAQGSARGENVTFTILLERGKGAERAP